MDLSHPSFHGHYNELSFSHHRPQIDVSSSSPPSRVPHNKHRRNLSSSTPKKQQIVALKQGFKEVWLRSDDGHITLSCLKEQGGIGLTLALLSTTTSMAKDHINPLVAALCANPTFMAGLMAWSLSQVMKVFTTFFVERRWDVSMLIGCGGMPSSHSALCVALTTSVAVLHGIGDALFPVCLGFTLIVMYDAIGVRRHAGMQAQVRAQSLLCLIFEL